LLNYGYALLESEIRKSINSIGLDYFIGFLHEINQSRTPLVYDVQELFRWLIDVSVIQLLEEKKIKKEDEIIIWCAKDLHQTQIWKAVWGKWQI